MAPSRRPATRAAMTKSSSLIEISRPRTTRARFVQPTNERMTVMAKKVWMPVHRFGTAAESAIHSGSCGSVMVNSMMRWMIRSTVPPK